MNQQEIADELVDAFEMFDSWDDRYSFLIDLGRKLPPMAASDKNEVTKVQGCQSSVWVVAQPRPVSDSDEMSERAEQAASGDTLIDFTADSDAAIVKGLIAILTRIYSGQTANDILAFDIESLIQRLELQQHLSMNRGNGLQAMIKRIKLLAAEVAVGQPHNATVTAQPA